MDGEYKPIICIICFNVKSVEHCTVVEGSIRNALDVLLLKPPIEESDKYICDACGTKVFEAFRFKNACMNTEGSIFPYLNLRNGTTPVDLKEVFLKEKGKKLLRSVSEDERICRLCMQIPTFGFTSVKDIEIDLIRIYIPEVNFNSTPEPVVCTACLESLKMHGGFLRSCLGVQKFENVCEDEAMVCQLNNIKTEEIDIKSEEHNEDIETPPLTNQIVDRKPKDNDIPKQRKTQKFECETCGYQSEVKRNLLRHQLRHKNTSELSVYKCDSCDFETVRKDTLARHRLRHKDTSQLQMYKCDECSYTTRYKGDLGKHQKVHKDISETQMYKCDACNYVTKCRGNLRLHQVKHKDVSEVRMYTCDTCDFQSKYRKSLVEHELRHKDASEVQMYKCEKCDYETRHRATLLHHQVKHVDISQVKTYKCDTCNFETRRKGALRRHVLKHRDTSHVQL